MTGNPSPNRKPYDTTPYAPLRASDGGQTEQPAAAGDERAKTAGRNEFEVENVKLKSLREALWAAFEAGPDAGLPNVLIDLTMAYTSALRLQLNLRSLAVRHASAKPVAPYKAPTPDPKKA